jgi:hypothetical protein
MASSMSAKAVKHRAHTTSMPGSTRSFYRERRIFMRWHLFGYHTYYPCGGMNDYIGAFSSREEALKASKSYKCDGYEIVYVEDDFALIVVASW